MKKEETGKESVNYELCLVLGLIGFLLGGIALTTVLTAYLKQRCK